MNSLFPSIPYEPASLKKEIGRESRYQRIKREHSYRKSESKEICCKNCISIIREKYNSCIRYKCKLIGVSNSDSTDIRLSSICNAFDKCNVLVTMSKKPDKRMI